jgi:transcription-repair coupling factor (superfamily II helicase)
LAIDLGIEKIILKSNKLIAYFISDKDSLFYKSAVFAKILSFLQKNPQSIKMKEGNNKLTLSIQKIDSIQKAIDIFKQMIEPQN